jgi:hypothetical protein
MAPFLKFLCTQRWQPKSRRHWHQPINLHLATESTAYAPESAALLDPHGASFVDWSRRFILYHGGNHSLFNELGQHFAITQSSPHDH